MPTAGKAAANAALPAAAENEPKCSDKLCHKLLCHVCCSRNHFAVVAAQVQPQQKIKK